MLPLLLLALMTPAPLEREVFEDPVFEFTMPIPDGLVALSVAEVASFDGVDAAERAILTREESPNGKVSHTFVWVDTTPLNRQVKVLLEDNSPPFLRPEVFVEAVTDQMGMTVDLDDSLSGDLAPCMYLEGTRTAADGTVMRTLVAYLPGPTRYGMIFFSAPAADWQPRHIEFLSMLESATFNRPVPEETQRQMAADSAARVGAANKPVKEEWDSLAVTGSLVLAALLVMGLFLGGKQSAA